MGLSNRISLLRKSLHLTQKEFGERIGVAANTVTNYENGVRTPMELTIKSICREFNVEYLWLTTGQGEMFMQPDDDITALVDDIMSGEDEFAKKLFKGLARLAPEDWQALERVLNKLLIEDKETE